MQVQLTSSSRYFRDNLRTSYDDYSGRFDLPLGPIFSGQLTTSLWWLFMQFLFTSSADIFRTTYEHLTIIIPAGLTYFQGRYFKNSLQTSYVHYSSRFDLLPRLIFSGQLTNSLQWLFGQVQLTSRADIFKTTYEHLKTIIRAGLTYFQGRYFQDNLQTSYDDYSCRVDLLPGPVFSKQFTNLLRSLFGTYLGPTSKANKTF